MVYGNGNTMYVCVRLDHVELLTLGAVTIPAGETVNKSAKLIRRSILRELQANGRLSKSFSEGDLSWGVYELNKEPTEDLQLKFSLVECSSKYFGDVACEFKVRPAQLV